MIEIAFIACLGAQCRDFSLTFAEVSLLQCQIGIGAQMQIAEWKKGHPNWQVKKHHCQIPGTFAKL
jgi:hypothetical protein